ncbi:enoyl-CoA hydratase/isomerase family protein [Sinisalibacter aestuarii]|uniref:3-hydroxyisobutyryl-CoA hydrolase n=1 Tax=Sinisalibacter aestuarii TaxID=2949426 RepID=A0ABQ5LXB8_9RHOB|nr:enoyl-CoA hydratase/isomerase family protein [Sinisalibacter aestuarii]GKY89626.1 enoyl-CoA hydratase [Sinisalibacter aestuarii]
MSDIRIRTAGRAGRITLARPEALNALSPAMSIAIEEALDAWRDDPAVALVVIDAEGERAFCAGGDIADIYRNGIAGRHEAAQAFWRQEYRMNARLAQFPKPVVTLMQGFTMGGGVGVGCHAGHRIVGESVKLAMPECGIGLIPDVGGTWILGHAPGHLGEYLGLTAARMGPADAIHAGFADGHVPEADWPALIAALEETGDVGLVAAAQRDPGVSPLAGAAGEIDRHFTQPTLAAIVDSLAAADSAFAQTALETMRRNSPLSMACALQLIRDAGGLDDITQALAQEYRFTHRAQAQGDFLEGIRAQIIDKDRNPRWRHDGPATVSGDEVAAMLAPLGEDELDLGGTT